MFQQSVAVSTTIKKEIKEEDVSVDSDSGDDSGDEEMNDIRILNDAAIPTLSAKKKKKKVTAEQLKNWEIEKVSSSIDCSTDQFHNFTSLIFR